MDLTGLGAIADLAGGVINRIWPDASEAEKGKLTLALAQHLDQEMTENARADRVRMDALLEKIAAMEAMLDRLRADYDAARHQTIAVQEQQTKIIEKLTDFSSRFVQHIEDESAERDLIKVIAEKVTIHSERISSLDRLLWAVIGACGVGFVGAVSRAISFIQSLH